MSGNGYFEPFSLSNQMFFDLIIVSGKFVFELSTEATWFVEVVLLQEAIIKKTKIKCFIKIEVSLFMAAYGQGLAQWRHT